MKIPHPIPYQGSKRNLAKHILPFFPNQINTLVEPFAGSAAISIAAACYGKASQFHLNDINRPLIVLWDEIIHQPEKITDEYTRLWNDQAGRERKYYDLVRDEFNKTRKPDRLLYLLARCVKASIRYNSKGEFNQSPDNRRLGRSPEQMRDDIFAVSKLFRGRTVLASDDYQTILKSVARNDLVYMDPPYQGVCNNGDPRYYSSGIEFEPFMQTLKTLNDHGISFILSYDGRTGEKAHGKTLPAELELHKIEINAGRSTQSTLLGRNDVTYESIYLSKALVERLGVHPQELASKVAAQQAVQLQFA